MMISFRQRGRFQKQQLSTKTLFSLPNIITHKRKDTSPRQGACARKRPIRKQPIYERESGSHFVSSNVTTCDPHSACSARQGLGIVANSKHEPDKAPPHCNHTAHAYTARVPSPLYILHLASPAAGSKLENVAEFAHTRVLSPPCVHETEARKLSQRPPCCVAMVCCK